MNNGRILCLSLAFTFACVVEDDQAEFRSGAHSPQQFPGFAPFGPERIDPPQPHVELPCSDVVLPAGPIDPLGEWCECMGSPTTGPTDPWVHFCFNMLTGDIPIDVTLYMFCEEHYGEVVELIQLFQESCSPFFGGNEGG